MLHEGKQSTLKIPQTGLDNGAQHNTHDSRHTVQGRDDLANYERMFYHLLNNSMKKRPKSATWHIRPDQRSGIDWKRLYMIA